MHRPRVLIPSVLAALLVTISALVATAAETPDRPTVAPAQLDAAAQATPPAATFESAPTVAQRWRRGLEEARDRRDAAVAALQAQLANATGERRMAIEGRLQLRKLDFEIEVLELQLTLDDEVAHPVDDAAHAAARQRVAEAVAAARDLRDAVAEKTGADPATDAAAGPDGEEGR